MYVRYRSPVVRTWARQASCEGKKPYLTYAHATNDARQVSRKSHLYHSVYRCQFCHRFHVGGEVEVGQ